MSSVNSQESQANSATTRLIDLYSASALDREKVGYFLDLQLSKLDPNMTIKPLTDLRESGHAAQSESQKACNSKEGEFDINKPWPRFPLIYRNTWTAAV